VDSTWKEAVWRQFGAAIDMLENAMVACPESLWNDRSRQPEFWQLAYHTLFWLDLYLSDGLEGFAPPAPFTLDELNAEAGPVERLYTRDELRAYLRHGRRKCWEFLDTLTDEKARKPSPFAWTDFTVAELLLYNLRHVQHGAAQLNLLLRQTRTSAPAWVARTAGGAE
jgi:hypothetical protein